MSRKLTVIDYRSTGLDVFYDIKPKYIRIEEHSCNGGRFGDILELIDIGGRVPKIPILLKIFKEDCPDYNWETMVRFQDRLIAERVRLAKEGGIFLNSYPALVGVPQFLVVCTLEGKEVKGYGCINLDAVGYISSDKILTTDSEDPVHWQNYVRRGNKLTTAYFFTQAVTFLRSIGFLHADITSSNLFISSRCAMCALIDFDSGAVIEEELDNPTTCGKSDTWSAPELLSVRHGDSVDINSTMDDWSISCALHQMVTAYPAFWLSVHSLNSLTNYTNAYKWPAADFNNTLFKPEKEKYLFYTKMLYKSLPDIVKNEFKETFSKGLLEKNRTFRTTPQRWLAVFEKVVPENSRIPKWRSFNELQPDFPNVQSEIVQEQLKTNFTRRSAQIGQRTIVWHKYINDLFASLVKNPRSISYQKSLICSIATSFGRDGTLTFEKLGKLLDSYQKLKADDFKSALAKAHFMMDCKFLDIDSSLYIKH